MCHPKAEQRVAIILEHKDTIKLELEDAIISEHYASAVSDLQSLPLFQLAWIPEQPSVSTVFTSGI